LMNVLITVKKINWDRLKNIDQ